MLYERSDKLAEVPEFSKRVDPVESTCVPAGVPVGGQEPVKICITTCAYGGEQDGQSVGSQVSTPVT